MDCVRSRLVTTEVQFVESAAGLRAAVASKDTVFAQTFAVDCLPQVLDIFVNIKVTGLHPHSWPALKTMWQRNQQVSWGGDTSRNNNRYHNGSLMCMPNHNTTSHYIHNKHKRIHNKHELTEQHNEVMGYTEHLHI